MKDKAMTLPALDPPDSHCVDAATGWCDLNAVDEALLNSTRSNPNCAITPKCSKCAGSSTRN
jgi:hypothetical protein